MTTDTHLSAPDPASPLPPPAALLPLSSADVAYRAEADRLAGTDTMADRIERLRAEVDALQVNAMRGQRPWYREIAAIVAVLALVFSFGTTFVSYDRTASQDAHDKRVELRSLIERLTAISREITETAVT